MDPEAFSALYEREAEVVLMFLTRRTYDAHLALELTAETFAEAWRARNSLRGQSDGERRGWLLTIAQRRYGRWLRRGRVERTALRRLAFQLPEFHEDDLAQVEERAGLPQRRSVLADELGRLSLGQRRAIELRVVEEKPYDEVAAALGVSEATARARVSRGLRALAKRLSDGETGGALDMEAS